MKINASEIRVGMLLEYKNDLWQVLKTQHVKPGKGGAFAQVEMKNVNKNTKLNNGLNIQVPPFIESGDEIIVDTRSLEYIKKI